VTDRPRLAKPKLDPIDDEDHPDWTSPATADPVRAGRLRRAQAQPRHRPGEGTRTSAPEAASIVESKTPYTGGARRERGRASMKANLRKLSVIEAELFTVLRREVKDILEIGQLLIEAKAQLGHGKWMPWLRDKFALSDRSARRYMQAAEFVDQNGHVSILNLTAGALYLLSSMEENEQDVVDAVLEEIKTKRVGVDRIVEIDKELEAIEDAKPGTGPPLVETEASRQSDIRKALTDFDLGLNALMHVRTGSAPMCAQISAGTKYPKRDIESVIAFLQLVVGQEANSNTPRRGPKRPLRQGHRPRWRRARHPYQVPARRLGVKST
jgi:hypothetical protein